MDHPTTEAINKDILMMIKEAPIPTGSIQVEPEKPKAEKPAEKTGDTVKVRKMEPTKGKTCKDGYTYDKRIHETSSGQNPNGPPKGEPVLQHGWIKKSRNFKRGVLEVIAEMEREANFKEIVEELEQNPEKPDDTRKEPEGPSVEAPPLEGYKEPPKAGETPRVTVENNRETVIQISQFIVDVLWIGNGVRVFGDEWMPKKMNGINKTEREYLIELWTQNLESSEMVQDMPDATVLILAKLNYFGERMLMNEGKSKTMEKVKEWAGSFKSRFGGKKQIQEKKDNVIMEVA